MNRSYLLVPVILLCVFGFFYYSYTKEAAVKATQVAEEQARIKADADSKKAAAEAKAREDAQKRADEREAEERKKASDKLAKYNAEIQKIRDDITKYTNQVNEQTKESARLDQDLANLRAAKEKANRESFELHKQVEKAEIEKHDAEFEIQRLTDMIAKRASDSAIARPLVATTAPAEK